METNKSNQTEQTNVTPYSSQTLLEYLQWKKDDLKPVTRYMADLAPGTVLHYKDEALDAKCIVLDQYHLKFGPMVNVIWIDTLEIETFMGNVEIKGIWTVFQDI